MNIEHFVYCLRCSCDLLLMLKAEPTVIQPPQYRKRFQNAMERYFMTVPDKWIQNDI